MVSESRDCSPEDKKIPYPFRVVSIRSVKAPPGLTGSDWYRYEICQGHNQIIGFRSGDKDKVNLAVKDIVRGLNFRRQLRRGRTHVVLGSGSRK